MLKTLQRLTLFLVGYSLTIQGVHVDLGVMTMTPTTFVTAVLLGLAALQFVTSRQRRSRDSKLPWVVAFGVSYLISSVYGFVEGAPFPLLFGETKSHLSLILYYFLIVYVVRSRDDLVLVLWSVLLGGMVSAIPAAFGIEVGREMEGGARFEGLSGQANVLGRDQAVCLAIAAALYFASQSRFQRMVCLFGGSVAVVGVILSLSRAAFAAAAGMWGLWMVRFRRLDTIQYAAPAVLILLAVALFAPTSVTYRVRSVVDPEERARDRSIETRFTQAVWSAKAFASNPLVGVGTVNFVFWAQEQPGGRFMTHVIHNGYLHVAASQGLVGFIPFMAIILLTWRDYSRAWRATRLRARLQDPRLKELGHYAVFLQIAYFGTLINALAHPATKAKTMWLLYALSTVVLGLVRQRVAELEGASVPAAAATEAAHRLPGLPVGPRPLASPH